MEEALNLYDGSVFFRSSKRILTKDKLDPNLPKERLIFHQKMFQKPPTYSYPLDFKNKKKGRPLKPGDVRISAVGSDPSICLDLRKNGPIMFFHVKYGGEEKVKLKKSLKTWIPAGWEMI